MGDESGKGAGGDAPDVSPGASFQVFVDMSNLYNKLKLLNYDDEYVLKWRMKPISRIHFAVATNAGDQLHAFIALSAWLFQKGGVGFDKPSEVRRNAFGGTADVRVSSRMMIKACCLRTSSRSSRKRSVEVRSTRTREGIHSFAGS